EGLRVLGQAGAAEARARVQELGPDAPVQAHALRDVLDVRPDRLGQVRHLVHERDLGRQTRVGRVFQQFRRAYVREQGRGLEQVQGRVDALQQSPRLLGARAD